MSTERRGGGRPRKSIYIRAHTYKYPISYIQSTLYSLFTPTYAGGVRRGALALPRGHAPRRRRLRPLRPPDPPHGAGPRRALAPQRAPTLPRAVRRAPMFVFVFVGGWLSFVDWTKTDGRTDRSTRVNHRRQPLAPTDHPSPLHPPTPTHPTTHTRPTTTTTPSKKAARPSRTAPSPTFSSPTACSPPGRPWTRGLRSVYYICFWIFLLDMRIYVWTCVYYTCKYISAERALTPLSNFPPPNQPTTH